jgi:hypothetical protein
MIDSDMNRPFDDIRKTLFERDRQSSKTTPLSPDVDKPTHNRPAVGRPLTPSPSEGESPISVVDMVGVDESTLKEFAQLLSDGFSVEQIYNEMKDITYKDALDLKNAMTKDEFQGDSPMDAYEDFKSDFMEDKDAEEYESPDDKEKEKPEGEEEREDEEDDKEEVEESQSKIYGPEYEVLDKIGDADDMLSKRYGEKDGREPDLFSDYIGLDFADLATADPEQTPENLLKLTGSAFLRELDEFNPQNIGIENLDEGTLEVEDEFAEIYGIASNGKQVRLAVHTDASIPYFIFEVPEDGSIVRMRFEGATPLSNLSLMMQQSSRSVILPGFEHKAPID